VSFLACLPLIAADIPAVLALDQRCLGGLWTHSGYQKELDSDYSDLLVLLSAPTIELLQHRAQLDHSHCKDALPDSLRHLTAQELAVQDLDTQEATAPSGLITLLGIGCLWAILEEAHITTLAIEPNCQGQKLGLLLLSHLLFSGYKRGLTRATLEVRSSNQKALALYQKFDFKEAGERKRYYSDGENARILWRSQLQSEACLQQLTQHQQSAISQIESAGNYRFAAEPS